MRRHDHACLFSFAQYIAVHVKQPQSTTNDDRRNVQLQIIDQARFQILLFVRRYKVMYAVNFPPQVKASGGLGETKGLIRCNSICI